jgi:hypothetical protein
MSPGIRATVEVSSTDVCPLTALSARHRTTIRSVSTSVSTGSDDVSVREFRINADEPLDDERVSHVISYGSTDVYRLEPDPGQTCPCECLGRHGCPVDRYTADDGVLSLVFHAADFQRLQLLITALRDRFPGIEIKRVIRDPDAGSPTEEVLVDRGKLTDRQFHALKTAYEMGYFERPKRANATEISEELDINRATFVEHISAAHRKLLEDVFD